MRLRGLVGRRGRCRQLSRRATGDVGTRMSVVVRVDVVVVVMEGTWHGRCILNFKMGRFVRFHVSRPLDDTHHRLAAFFFSIKHVYATHVIVIASCPSFYSLLRPRSFIIVLVRGVEFFGHNHSFPPCSSSSRNRFYIEWRGRTHVFNDRLSTTLILINVYHNSSS